MLTFWRSNIITKSFPKTVVIHHRSGIGDLIWHLPYIRAIALQSAEGKVTLVAKPSNFASQVLAGEECIAEVIEFDYRPRNTENRKGRHDSVGAQLDFALELKKRRFERMVNFSPRIRYNLLGIIAGISCRIGFGFSYFERLTLNGSSFIERYRGSGNWVYPEATSLMVANGFVNEAILPRMKVSPESISSVKSAFLFEEKRKLIAFSIGTSLVKKQWGAQNFAQLADKLLELGYSVVLLGGVNEKKLAEEIELNVQDKDKDKYLISSVKGSIQTTAAFLTLSSVCVGNDTGVLNMSLACETPAVGLFGASQIPELNDPLMHVITGNGMNQITPLIVYDYLSSVFFQSPLGKTKL